MISMLGGASDRTAQLQAIAVMLAGREEVLHLIVVWPCGMWRRGFTSGPIPASCRPSRPLRWLWLPIW